MITKKYFNQFISLTPKKENEAFSFSSLNGCIYSDNNDDFHLCLKGKKNYCVKNSVLKKMKFMEIEDCFFEEAKIGKVKILRIKNCFYLKKIEIKNCKDISILNCPNLEEIILPPKTDCIRINNCKKLEKIQNNFSCKAFDLINCFNFKDFTSASGNDLYIKGIRRRDLKDVFNFDSLVIENGLIDFVDNIKIKSLFISNSFIGKIKTHPITQTLYLSNIHNLTSLEDETLELDDLTINSCLDLKTFKAKTIRAFFCENFNIEIDVKSLKCEYVSFECCNFKNLNLEEVPTASLDFCNIKNLFVKNKVFLHRCVINTLHGKMKFPDELIKQRKALFSEKTKIKKMENSKLLKSLEVCRNCPNFSEKHGFVNCSLDKYQDNSENIFLRKDFSSNCPFKLEMLVLK